MIHAVTARGLSNFHRNNTYGDSANEYSTIMSKISTHIEAAARLGENCLVFNVLCAEKRQDIILELLRLGFSVTVMPNQPDKLNINW